MYPKVVFLIILLILQLPMNIFSRDKRYTLSMIVLFLFAALRGNGDGDYYSYLRYSNSFHTVSDLWKSFPMEMGFRIISLIKNKLGLIDQFVIIAMNGISLFFIHRFIKKHSKNKLFSIILFLPLYFQFDMHAARTAVAIGISTASFDYLIERKFIRFVIIIMIASVFHKSAWVMLPVYFLTFLRFNYIVDIYFLLIISIISLYVPYNEIIIKLLAMLKLNTLSLRFKVYTESLKYGYEFKLIDFRFLLLLIIYCLQIYFYDKSNKKQIFLHRLTYMNILFLVMLKSSTSIALRATSYLNIYTLVSIPEVISCILSREYSLSYFLVVSMLMVVYLVYILFFIVNSVDYRFFF